MILNLPYKVDARGMKIVCVSLERYPQEILFRKVPPGGYKRAKNYLMLATENYF